MRGRLTADATHRTTKSGDPWVTFTIVDTPRRKTDAGEWEDAGPALFLPVTFFGGFVESCAPHLTKGRMVVVTGQLRGTAWEKDGQKRTGVELQAQAVAIVPSKPQQQAQGQQAGPPEGWTAVQPPPPPAPPQQQQQWQTQPAAAQQEPPPDPWDQPPAVPPSDQPPF